MLVTFKFLERLGASLFSPTGKDTKPTEGLSVSGNGARQLVRRRQRLQEGFIASERILKPRACTLRDMTYFGGRIDLWDDIRPQLLTAGFVLYIVGDQKEVDCKVMWIREKSVGLKFLGPMREPSRKYM